LQATGYRELSPVSTTALGGIAARLNMGYVHLMCKKNATGRNMADEMSAKPQRKCPSFQCFVVEVAEIRAA
jgi:hypothetical protein